MIATGLHAKSKALRAAAAVVLGVLSLCGPASAADPRERAPALAPVTAQEPRLVVTATAYLWATGLQGRLRTLPPLPAVNVDIGFDQVMKNFDGGIMGAGEIRYGRAMLFFDVMASQISPSKTFFPLGFPANVKITSGSFTGLVAGGYRLIDDPVFVLDALAGVRVFNMRNSLKIQTMPAALKLSESEQWVDGVAGARLRINFAPSWHAVAIGFAGGGGSRYLWDIYGGLGYDFNAHWTGFAGYRVMKVDYSRGNFIYDALQHGPMVGLQARF
jgi:hypothetical protein